VFNDDFEKVLEIWLKILVTDFGELKESLIGKTLLVLIFVVHFRVETFEYFISIDLLFKDKFHEGKTISKSFKGDLDNFGILSLLSTNDNTTKKLFTRVMIDCDRGGMKNLTDVADGYDGGFADVKVFVFGVLS
jgi:hypothetical protein